MIRELKNVSGSEVTINDLGIKLANNQEKEIEQDQLGSYLASTDLETLIDDGDIQVGDGTTFYTNANEGQCYFRTMFGDEFYLIDGSSLDQFAPVIVTDSLTSKKASSMAMNMLTIMRELYNDPGDPLYDSGFTPILGSTGWGEAQADRILNLETIHGDLGWHTQMIVQATYKKPSDILFYYGWMNSFNSAVNSWNNELVAHDMAKFQLVVLGDGIQESSHGDYANTQIIIPRIQALNPNTKIFGYVTVNQSLANFEDKCDEWETLGVDGIFLDEAGYDYGTTTTNGRAAFNTKVDYVHALTNANLCFANCWNMDHIIGTENDVSYPNTTWNPSLVASNLTFNDWYLLESLAVNTTAYSSAGGYATKGEWAARGLKATGHRGTYGINVASVGIIANTDSDAQDLFDFCFASACMWSLEANGSSDTAYGASSAKVDFHTRPDVSQMGRIYSCCPTVQVDVGDNDVYWRYVDFGRFSLDFSAAAQDSDIEKW